MPRTIRWCREVGDVTDVLLLDLFSLTPDSGELADCSAASYDTLSVEAAQKMLVFSSQADLLQYVAAAHPDWHVEAGVIHFQPSHKARLEVPSMALVENMLAYATELDRIV